MANPENAHRRLDAGGITAICQRWLIEATPPDTTPQPKASRWGYHSGQVDQVDNLVKIDPLSRLTIEIDPEQHRKIKTLATFAGMSIKDFILARTLAPPNRTAEDTTSPLLGAPNNAARLRAALETPASEHIVFESLEDLNRALGI